MTSLTILLASQQSFTPFWCLFLLASTYVALSGAEDKEKLLKEVTLMLTFNHPNLMPITGMSFDGEVPLIIMPFMLKGSVLDYVRKHRDDLYFTDFRNCQHEVETKTLAQKLVSTILHVVPYLLFIV